MTLEGGLWLRDGEEALAREDIEVGIDDDDDGDSDIEEGGWGRPDDLDEFSSSSS